MMHSVLFENTFHVPLSVAEKPLRPAIVYLALTARLEALQAQVAALRGSKIFRLRIYPCRI
jgi:hypothetical protein